MNRLEDFLMPGQKALFRTLGRMFGKMAICKKGSYILVPGEAPVMLVAHMDTVHQEPVKHICKTQDGNILMSPQGIGGDDRCGVYALVTAYRLSSVKPWLLFTCDEETGGIGAKKFCKEHEEGGLPEKLDELKAIVEIDRKGRNDAVYYDCGNEEFEAYITSKGFKTSFGTFSDISYVAPELGVAAVNLSSGYYDAHTKHEYINLGHLNATIGKVVEIVSDSVKAEFPKYEYIEKAHYFGRYGGWYGDDWDICAVGASRTKDKSGLSEVPEHLRGIYKELMYFHSLEELEYYRDEFGDSCIPMLYESEFGMPYEKIEDDPNDKKK